MAFARGAATLVVVGLLVANPAILEPQAATPTPVPAQRPPNPAATVSGTDIFLLDVGKHPSGLRLGPPQRITDRAGYDNQPSFLSDGRTLCFTSVADGQADVLCYDLASKQTRAWTRTTESEFSPTLAPGGGLSVVRVEKDGDGLGALPPRLHLENPGGATP